MVGCASPEYVARQSNFDVCRLTMGGPHSAAAEAEARNRGLDCAPLYPAIQAKQANENAAINNYLRSMQQPLGVTPLQTNPTVNCQSYRSGNTVQTHCN